MNEWFSQLQAKICQTLNGEDPYAPPKRPLSPLYATSPPRDHNAETQQEDEASGEGDLFGEEEGREDFVPSSSDGYAVDHEQGSFDQDAGQRQFSYVQPPQPHPQVHPQQREAFGAGSDDAIEIGSSDEEDELDDDGNAEVNNEFYEEEGGYEEDEEEEEEEEDEEEEMAEEEEEEEEEEEQEEEEEEVEGHKSGGYDWYSRRSQNEWVGK